MNQDGQDSEHNEPVENGPPAKTRKNTRQSQACLHPTRRNVQANNKKSR